MYIEIFCMNWSTNFRGLPFNEEMVPSWLKQMNPALSRLQFSDILIHKDFKFRNNIEKWESFRGVVANMLDYDIVVSDFELQSRYYVHFRTNTLEKGMNPFIHHPAMG